MGVDLSSCLVVGISSRSLFDSEKENEIFESQGLDAFRRYQLENEELVLPLGTAYPLVKALLDLNNLGDGRLVEVIIMSHNSPDMGLRIFNSIRHYQIDISRAAFTGGKSLIPYLQAFNVDLFLSKQETDVQAAIDAGFAAATIYDPPQGFDPHPDQIRIAFDADAVLFSEESEHLFKEKGLDAFHEHESEQARSPLAEGPFAKLLKTLSFLQSQIKANPSPVRLAIVTARSSPAHERIIRTLRTWEVQVDEAFFLGGITKDRILQAFRPHIFFDDQEHHLGSASKLVPSGKVPYKSGSPMHRLQQEAKKAAQVITPEKRKPT